MSSKDLARRAAVEVYIAGADISESLQPYFLSLTYTDNEEDEADDLQIKIQDREGLWLSKWLETMVQAAASEPSAAQVESAASSHRVTAKSGLNVRSGPGTDHSKLGALAYGATVAVTGTSGGWSVISYSGQTAYVYSQYLEPTGDAEAPADATVTGLQVQAVIVQKNWQGDGKDNVLDCGQFELDALDASGPASEITIKATSLPYSSQIRQTKKNRAWEAYKLSGIANEMAAKNGMACLYESEHDPYYERVEQVMTSDIAFLSTLCHDAGISLKATNNIIVLFDQAAYESKQAAFDIKRGAAGGYVKYKLSTGEASKEYASCRVSYTDPSSGRVIEATAYVEDYKDDAKNNQHLQVQAKVGSIAEAKTLAEKLLRLRNKHAKTATFTVPGNPDLVAGVTVTLTDWGLWSGKYIISQAKHSVGSSGYTTQIKLRCVLEGY